MAKWTYELWQLILISFTTFFSTYINAVLCVCVFLISDLSLITFSWVYLQTSGDSYKAPWVLLTDTTLLSTLYAFTNSCSTSEETTSWTLSPDQLRISGNPRSHSVNIWVSDTVWFLGVGRGRQTYKELQIRETSRKAVFSFQQNSTLSWMQCLVYSNISYIWKASFSQNICSPEGKGVINLFESLICLFLKKHYYPICDENFLSHKVRTRLKN